MVARANPQSFPSWYKYDPLRNSLAIQVSQFWLTKYHQVVSLKHAIYDGSIKVAHLSRADLLPENEQMFSINISQTCVWTHARTRAQAENIHLEGTYFLIKKCWADTGIVKLPPEEWNYHNRVIKLYHLTLVLPIPVFNWSYIPHFEMSYSLNFLCAAQKSIQPLVSIHFHFVIWVLSLEKFAE